jgi:two-component system cell cycle response regulator DivK
LAVDSGSELFARKGRASARGFSTGTVDAVTAEVARSAQPAAPIELAPSAAERSSFGRQQPFRALVADRDPLSRKLYRDILEADGYDVVVATDGTEALAAYRRRAPDIAVVNLRLAEVPGIEVMRQIINNGPGNIPVVAVAERYRPVDEDSSRSVGCAAYLPKPISVRKLLDTIDRLVKEDTRIAAG